MSGSSLSPATLRTVLIAVGILLLVAAALADVLKLPGTRPGSPGRGVVRVLLALVGAGLVGWGLFTASGPAPVVAAPSATPPATPAPPADLVQAASAAIAECPIPTAPPVPDASGASLQQMQGAAAAFKTYDAAVVSYTQCVDGKIADLRRQFGAAAAQADMDRLTVFGNTVHNTAIDQEQALADKFNTQVRLFKSRHPG
jgi:hypothetical protein